ncbi:DmsC/YnfH family molybdoenzyme membrane anchor subunit [Planctomycetes bacterium K23_9]|uniref:Anaerobic dimethyl sulfoxide reductase chain B n=1 Tax=Stieleria marina TaxID=1930275 RepID=A0A517P1U9_9BACT|nr:Anaerobic dimethyl sulfoxide reductase chain B [Planctomycetes bacterium K23_9]
MSIASTKTAAGPDFISALIDDQQSLTAVERFSALHETGKIAPDGPAQERYYRDLLPASPPSPEEQFAFEVDLDKCSGCKACVVACHTMNGLEEEESWRRVGTVTIGVPSSEATIPNSAVPQALAETAPILPMIQHVTTACHHCEDPGCLNGCPVRAYEKDPATGIVRHLDDQCIGCKYCTMMCPYEVPQYSDRLGIVRKCDMCHQRLSVGEAPACVQSCPNEAIAIRTVPRIQEPVQGDRIAPGAPVSTITKPTTRYVGREMNAATSVPQDAGVDEVAESHWPLAVMLVATQVSVGMIAVERIFSAVLYLAGGSVDASVVRWNSTLALVIGIVGLNLASLHLGQPLRAWRVFLGLRTSWLSREAVVLGKYVGLLSVAVSLLWMPMFADWVPEAVTNLIPARAGSVTLALAIPVGLTGLYCSAMIYIATRRQLWRFSRTLIRFIGTTVISGMAFAAAVYAAGGNTTVAFLIALSATMFLAAKLLFEHRILVQREPEADDEDEFARFDARSKTLVRKDLWRLVQARSGTAVIGGLVLAIGGLVALFAGTTGCALIAVGAVLVSAGELGERLLYFTSVVYDRMPGTFR